MRNTSFKEGYKICRTCNQELPETAEYFVRATNTKSGLGAMCILWGWMRIRTRALYTFN